MTAFGRGSPRAGKRIAVAPYSENPDETAAPAASPRPTARRRPDDSYSRFLGWMKYLLPAAALILLGLVLFWPVIQQTGERIARQTEDLARTAPLRNFEMANPRYEGRDDEGRPFVLTASSARQAELGADRVRLREPRAQVTLENGNLLTVTAERGVFLQDERLLTLRGDVNVYHDAGYTFKTELAILDMRENTAHGDEPVIATGPKGTLEAQGFRVLDDGKTVLFTGRSRVTLTLTNQDMRDLTGGRPRNVGQ